MGNELTPNLVQQPATQTEIAQPVAATETFATLTVPDTIFSPQPEIVPLTEDKFVAKYKNPVTINSSTLHVDVI